MYLTRASEVAGVAKEILGREAEAERHTSGSAAAERRLHVVPRESTRPAAAPRENGIAGAPGAETTLVWVLLHYRVHLEAASEQVGPEHFSNPTLRDIYRALLELEPEQQATVLLERVTPEHAAGLAELLERPISDEMDVGAMVRDSVVALLRSSLERDMATIDRDMSIASTEEKNELLIRKQRLAADWRALGGGTFKIVGR